MIKTWTTRICILIGLVTLTGCVLPTEADRVSIPGWHVKQAILEATGKEIEPLDSTYLAYSVEELRRVLESDTFITGTPYIQDTYDCDDYALEFMVYVKRCMERIPFGYVRLRKREKDRVTAHMANVFVDGEMIVWLVNWQLTEDFVKLKGAGFIIFEVSI